MCYWNHAMWRIAASLLAVAMLLSSCWDSRCSQGQRQEGAVCVPIPDASTADRSVDKPAALSDGSAQDVGAAAEGGGGDADSGLGKVCTEPTDCVGAASFCAIQPGTAEGYCTFEDCTVGGNDCPQGYECIDLSMYLPGLTACIKV
jgi:hypothetical protein